MLVPFINATRRLVMGMEKVEADVIIPVYKPEKTFLQLLELLSRQKRYLGRIIIINTEKKCFDERVSEQELLQKYDNLLIRHISKEEFDHGKTRNYGVSLSDSPYFVMLTDDCLPNDDNLLQNLLATFENPQIAISYGRQLPGEGCGMLEAFTRSFNYPEASREKYAEDIPEMGIKAFFASNVCAAYRRETFDTLGGFVSKTIFNEDMIYARRALDNGFGIAYAADAQVIHSHNYSGLQQFHRNFDLGVSHAQFPEIFGGITAESEGMRLIRKTCRYLIQKGRPWLIIKLFWQSAWKYAGYFLGKRYRKLPQNIVVLCSMNKDYWKQQKNKNLSQFKHKL